jgi:hypothetical protein
VCWLNINRYARGAGSANCSPNVFLGAISLNQQPLKPFNIYTLHMRLVSDRQLHICQCKMPAAIAKIDQHLRCHRVLDDWIDIYQIDFQLQQYKTLNAIRALIQHLCAKLRVYLLS